MRLVFLAVDEVLGEYFSSKFTFSIGPGGFSLRLCCDTTRVCLCSVELSVLEKIERFRGGTYTAGIR